MTVYIEGDGFAWRTRRQLSPDPTPRHPLVMSLATLDPSSNVAYLARPCQYQKDPDPNCRPDYWSDRRFSEEVVGSMNQALDGLKRASSSQKIHLIGYSGGGAIAVLIAARRSDVASLRTVAGNLDPDGVFKHHHVPRLKGSLDPLAEAASLSALPQRHFTGTNDKTVPPFVTENFLKASGHSACVAITPVSGATHGSGWQEEWTRLLAMPLSCTND